MLFKKKLTLEELREQADRLGYRIVKKEDYVSFIPCVCGTNKRSMWTTVAKDGGKLVTFKCKKCGLTITGKTEKEARLNWNETVKRLKEEN